MSTGEKKEYGDGEITQDNGDVLRGSDIIPGASSHPEGTNQISVDSTKSEVPQFDLANNIMAEQRMITAVRRKGPGRKAAPAKEKAPSISEAAPPATPVQRVDGEAETERIIADIVRRDIERLCKGLDVR